ncbi:MAG: hypothetical protein WCF52_15705 [Pseudolabrys sp.]
MTYVPLTFVAAVARLLRRGVGKLRNQALEVAKDVEKLGGLLRVFRLGHFAGGTLRLEQAPPITGIEVVFVVPKPRADEA